MRAVAAFAVVSLAAPQAFAQLLPPSVSKGTAVTKGKTDVMAEEFHSAARNFHAEDEAHASELSIAGGAIAASGNTKTLGVTAALVQRLRRNDDQISSAAAVNYGRASVGGRPSEVTVENLQGRIRYDRFFLEDWSAFLAAQARSDRLAGLVARLRVDPGIGYFFVDVPRRAFWVELGYDLLHDIRREDARTPVDDFGERIPDAPPIAKTSTVHGGRLFVGYRYRINAGVSIAAGLEYLQGVSDPGIQRLNGEATITSKFSEQFSLATSFLFRYDDRPLPGKEPLDVVSGVALVYTMH